MRTIADLKHLLQTGGLNEQLMMLYGCTELGAKSYAERYIHILCGLDETFGPHKTAALFSAPGRTEIGGNHTDHQHGCVLAGSVNIDMIAAVAPNDLRTIRMHSEGYSTICVDLQDLQKHLDEENSTASLLRGTCAAFSERNAKLSGLDIYVSSNVPKGSGVSSSAAFEVLLGTIMNELFMDAPLDAIEIAKISQWVENVYFGKPCGLMDQMASSVGGIVGIDFKDPTAPVVEQIDLNLADAGLSLCIIDSGADHADLTDEYAAVPNECCRVAQICGAKFLRDVPYDVFQRSLPACRVQLGDRAVLRAMHFFADNARVDKQLDAIRRKDYIAFLQLVNESGHSSFEYLQNVIPAGATQQQAVALTIAVAKDALQGRGAVRVHGGGFAGTVQAFVPVEMVPDFRQKVEAVLGKDHCSVMLIRPVGGYRLA